MAGNKSMDIVEKSTKNETVCEKSRGDRARELFREGYNCSQAVTLAFAEELEARGISREMAAGLASSFGGGLGRLREVCGCVSGMALVCGALEGYTDPKAAVQQLYVSIHLHCHRPVLPVQSHLRHPSVPEDGLSLPPCRRLPLF